MQLQSDLDPKVNQLVERVKQQRPTQRQDELMQNRLMAAIDKVEVHEQRTSLWQSMRVKITNLPKMATLSMAASFAFVMVMASSLLLSSGISSPAFASVVEALKKISTMHYVGNMYTNGQAQMELEVYYQAPDRVRIENTPLVGQSNPSSVINIMDTSTGQGLILMEAGKMAIPFNFEPQSTSSQYEQMQDDPLYWLDTIMQYKGEVERLDTQNINGLQTSGYRIYPQHMVVTVWINPEDKLPVKLVVQSNPESNIADFRFEADMQFNQSLDPALFSVQFQDGYQLMQ